MGGWCSFCFRHTGHRETIKLSVPDYHTEEEEESQWRTTWRAYSAAPLHEDDCYNRRHPGTDEAYTRRDQESSDEAESSDDEEAKNDTEPVPVLLLAGKQPTEAKPCMLQRQPESWYGFHAVSQLPVHTISCSQSAPCRHEPALPGSPISPVFSPERTRRALFPKLHAHARTQAEKSQE